MMKVIHIDMDQFYAAVEQRNANSGADDCHFRCRCHLLRHRLSINIRIKRLLFENLLLFDPGLKKIPILVSN